MQFFKNQKLLMGRLCIVNSWHISCLPIIAVTSAVTHPTGWKAGQHLPQPYKEEGHHQTNRITFIHRHEALGGPHPRVLLPCKVCP